MALTQSPLLWIVGGALVSYILYTRIALYLRRQRMIKEHGCKPCPYVFNKDPILGLDVFRDNIQLSKAKRILPGFRSRFLNLKTNTFHSRMMDLPLIATCEPENVKTILSLKFKDFTLGARTRAFSPLLGDGIFNSDGEKWANSRHLLRPNFARDQVADLEAFERHFKLMLKHIPKDGSTVDLQQLFFRFTIDTATEFLFNHSTDSLRMMDVDENNEDVIFSKAFTEAQDDIMMRTRLGFLDVFRPNKKGNEAIKICHAYVDKFVDDAIAWRREHDAEKAAGWTQEDGRYVFIRELAKQTDDRKRIRDELMNILLAGRDTTASLLSNMWFEIAKRPEVWTKLREEVKSLDGRLPTYEELRNLKYLRWCLNECKSCPSPPPPRSASMLTSSIQPSASTPSSPATPATASATPCSPSAAGPTASTRSSCARARSSATRPSPCTAAPTSTGPTPTTSAPSAGRRCAPAGNTCPSTAARASASASSTP